VSDLPGWTAGTFSADGRAFPTYRRGSGPPVIVVHEIPGITPPVLRFADEVVDTGFTVVLPHLFGTLNDNGSLIGGVTLVARLCVRSEFTKLALHVTSPIAGWLRALARSLHSELGGPGVGAVGMCFTGGLALAMMVDASVVAPVLAQPSLPFAIGKKRAADLNLSPADLATVRTKAASGCPVLGVRYRGDRATGTRFETLRGELGDDFVALELDGKKHATLTAHRQQEAVDRVLAFLRSRLQGAG
jgi:dienelactone hydrolase